MTTHGMGLRVQSENPAALGNLVACIAHALVPGRGLSVISGL